MRGTATTIRKRSTGTHPLRKVDVGPPSTGARTLTLSKANELLRLPPRQRAGLQPHVAVAPPQRTAHAAAHCGEYQRGSLAPGSAPVGEGDLSYAARARRRVLRQRKATSRLPSHR